MQLHLTPEELVNRWSNAVSVATLANWRAKRVGPQYIKIGGRVLYPIALLEEYEKHNLIETQGK